MEKAKALKQLILEQNMSVRKFSQQAGMPYTTLRSILERGVGNSSVDNVLKICKALNITTEQLSALTQGIDTRTPHQVLRDFIPPMKRIPIISRIAFRKTTSPKEYIAGYEYVNDDSIDCAFIVGDDSMSKARILQGDLVYVTRQSEANIGDIVIALTSGDDAAIRRFGMDKNKITLLPENPKGKVKKHAVGDVKIIGKVVRVAFNI